MDSLPEDTPDNIRMKEVFRHTCAGCHQVGFVLQHQFDEAGWRAIVTLMERFTQYRRIAPKANPIISHYKEELVAYLTKMRGPGPSPLKFKVRPRPRGDAARVVITEYDIPPAETPDELVVQDGSDWSEGVPSMGNGAQGIHDVQVDVNGNAWATDSEPNLFRTYVKVDPKTGHVTGFKLPTSNEYAWRPHGIAQDPSGNLWTDTFRPNVLNLDPSVGDETLTEGQRRFGSLTRIDPKTEKMDIFTPPYEMSNGTLTTVDSDAHGKIWAQTTSGIILFEPTTQKFTYFKSVTPGGGYGAAGDADGNGWWTNPDKDVVGMADPEAGKTVEVRMIPQRGLEEFLTPSDRKVYDSRGSLTWASISIRAGSEQIRKATTCGYRIGGDRTSRRSTSERTRRPTILSPSIRTHISPSSTRTTSSGQI